MEALVEKILKVVDSCVTPQQLEIAENFAERARKQVHREQWLDIAGVIQSKAGQILFYDAEDWTTLKRV
jgi:hypothetical protein